MCQSYNEGLHEPEPISDGLPIPRQRARVPTIAKRERVVRMKQTGETLRLGGGLETNTPGLSVRLSPGVTQVVRIACRKSPKRMRHGLTIAHGDSPEFSALFRMS